jgi:HEAT repeat protein
VDKALRDALDKLQGKPLVGVIGSIGVRHDAKAVNALVKLLQAPDADVAQAAARALGKIGNANAAKALEAALPSVPAANQLAFCEGLLRCAETLAAKGYCKQAMAIYDHLRAIQAPHQVRTAALRGAVLTRQQAGLPLLLESMRGADFALFAAVARISQEMPGTDVTRALAAELAVLPADKQILLIQTLGKRGDATALPALLALARNGEKPVRVAAVRAVAEFGNGSALPVLIDLLGDADKDIAAAAQESLASLPGSEVDAAIIKMLSTGSVSRRITAMEFIARRRTASAIPALFDAAGDSDPNMRTAAVKKLGELAGPADLSRLLDLLGRATSPEDLEATEQALSAVSLKAADPVSCVGQVESRLAKAPPAQKCALIRVLGAIGGSGALKAVRDAVNDPNIEVRAAAVRTLSGWAAADAAPDLLELARSAVSPTDKMLCLRGYLRLAGQAELPVDKRLAMCRQAADLAQKDEEKKLLLAALGSIASVEALDLITPYLGEAGTKEEAATAAVDVSDNLLKGKDAAKLASRLVGPLDKVAQITANADLAKRAKDLRDQAKSKTN